MKRRLFSIAAALALCLSICPAWAFAAEVGNDDPDTAPGAAGGSQNTGYGIGEDTVPAENGLKPAAARADALAGGNWTDGLTAAPEGWAEDGDTIFISTPEALAWLAVLVEGEEVTTLSNNPTLGKTVVLEADLDLSGKNWVPIGSGKTIANAFAGSFDGNGHTISNLTIVSNDGDNFVGLFGNAHLNGPKDACFIRNITVKNASITTNQFTARGYVGVLAGQVIGQGTLTGCTASGTINCQVACNNVDAGGMFGYLNPASGLQGSSSIYLNADRCFADVDIMGAPVYAGGFVGELSSCGQITNCGAAGDVDVTDPYPNYPAVGGFVGDLALENDIVRIENCYATGSVSLSSSSSKSQLIYAGGFLGCIDIPDFTAAIQGCMSSGDVTVTASASENALVGGFIGNGWQDPILTVTNSYSTGDVMAANGAMALCGGFIGYGAATVENCYSLGNVTSKNSANAWAMGFSGNTRTGASFTNCYALGARMEGDTYASNFLNGSITLTGCGCYENVELVGTDISRPSADGLSKEDIMAGTAFSGFSTDIWQIPGNGPIPILIGIPDEVEKTSKPVYLDKIVTFNTQGGSPVSSQTVATGEAAIKPDDPVKENFIFEGWYTQAEGGEAFDFSAPITDHLTLYARWSAAPIHVTGVTISQSVLSLEAGKTAPLSAAVFPADAADKSVTWTSSDPGVAAVSAAGTVTAVSAGTATITVTTTDGGKTAVCTVTVTAPEEPDTPDTPDNPDTPDTPDTPSTPSQPSTPSIPSRPGPSGSSGSTSGSGTTALPVTTTGQNGAAATTTTAVPSVSIQGGKAVAVVDVAMGNEIVRQAVSNGSEIVTIAPEIAGSPAQTEVSIPAFTVGQIGSQTNACLTVSTPVAGVTIPNGGLNSLSGESGTVVVAAERSGSAVELSIMAGGRTVESIPGGVTLTVPVSYAAPGTVAVLIHRDGTREVVRKSVASGGSVTIPLNGSATLEIVDNSQYFYDVPATSWAADAAAFVSAHELFSGTGTNQFGPDQPMSRGMLAVALHNLENNPAQALTSIFTDVSGSAWYAEGVAWAAAHGIVDGYGNGQFGPGDSITREQLAVMLWRYAGCPASANQELHFTDAHQVSDWAAEALRWAVENGVIHGKGNGILDPGGYATRAETAQMLKNFMERQ